jgi:hypothetical protein
MLIPSALSWSVLEYDSTLETAGDTGKVLQRRYAETSTEANMERERRTSCGILSRKCDRTCATAI